MIIHFRRPSLFSRRRYIKKSDPRQFLLPLRPLPLSLILCHAPALAFREICAAIATHTGLATAEQGRGAQSLVFLSHIIRFMQVRRYASALNALITLNHAHALSKGITPPPRKSTRLDFLRLAELVFPPTPRGSFPRANFLSSLNPISREGAEVRPKDVIPPSN